MMFFYDGAATIYKLNNFEYAGDDLNNFFIRISAHNKFFIRWQALPITASKSFVLF